MNPMGSDVKQKPEGIPEASGDTNSLLRADPGRPSWIPIDFKEDAGVNLPRIAHLRRLFRPRGAFHARAGSHPTGNILLLLESSDAPGGIDGNRRRPQ